MTFFNSNENQTMRLYGPESHRRKLTPENNRWQRDGKEMREQQAQEAQRKLEEEIGE